MGTRVNLGNANKCAYLNSLFPAAGPHVSHLPLQLGSGFLAVFKAVLSVSEPQQLLLQQAVLSLQKHQLTGGRSRSGLPVRTDLPQTVTQSCRRLLLLLQQL